MERSWRLSDAAAYSLGLTPNVHAERHEGGESILIRERISERFLSLFFAAVERGCTIWLAAPDWGEDRLGELEKLNRIPVAPGSILIPTGGTSGQLRYAVHTWDTLCASVTGFLDFFGQHDGHRALCALPLHHVSGLMQAVRVVLAGGRLYSTGAHNPKASLPDDFKPEGVYFSLVPTQLRRLLDAGEAPWLRRFECLLLGGAATEPTLLHRAMDERLPLCPSYGMTETAAMVTALRPEEFLSLGSAGGAGQALGHAAIEIVPQNGYPEGTGRVRIRAKSLCKELLPGGKLNANIGLETNDLGRIDAEGHLHLLGRLDRVIVSGALKLDPAEIEGVIMASGLVQDTVVVGLPDKEWGQVASAFYVANEEADKVEPALRDAIREKLSPAHVPKKWFRMDAIPRSEAGKLDSARLRKLAGV